jgi:hypothetical protein
MKQSNSQQKNNMRNNSEDKAGKETDKPQSDNHPRKRWQRKTCEFAFSVYRYLRPSHPSNAVNVNNPAIVVVQFALRR